jgi:hypothetical protein
MMSTARPLLLAWLACACLPALPPTPTLDSKQPIAIEPTPAADVVEQQPAELTLPRCAELDLGAWRDELEQAAPDARAELLARMGFLLDDDGDLEADPHPALHVRSVQIHEVQLGGPPGIERVLELVVVDDAQLGLDHAHALVQVFTRSHVARLCRTLEHGQLSTTWIGSSRPAVLHSDPQLSWYPQALGFVELLAPGVHAIELRRATGVTTAGLETSEYSLSYLSLDEQGGLTEIFGPVYLYYRKYEQQAAIPMFDVRTTVGVHGPPSHSWPATIETREETVAADLSKPRPVRETTVGRWQWLDGVYVQTLRRTSVCDHPPECRIVDR